MLMVSWVGTHERFEIVMASGATSSTMRFLHIYIYICSTYCDGKYLCDGSGVTLLCFDVCHWVFRRVDYLGHWVWFLATCGAAI